MATSSSSSVAGEPPRPDGEKPVVVRVKRKLHHSRLDAFWLEINERPWKRQMLELEKLSINHNSRDSSIRVEELGPRKVLVKHVETVIGSKDAIDLVQSVVMPQSAEAGEGAARTEERRQMFKKHSNQEQLLSKARQSRETFAKSVRFEQIWRSRRGNKEASSDEAVHDVCHFYDIVRVDDEERLLKVQEHEVLSLEDQRLLSSYLPLLKDFIPSAAAEIESDLHPSSDQVGNPSAAAEIESDLHPSSDQDDYVYDYYTVEDNTAMKVEDASSPFPLVQVEEDDFYDGPDDESECDSIDSNAEKHPHNEYPDELSEDEDDDEEEEEEEEEETVDTEAKSDDELDQGHKVQGLFDTSLYENGINDMIRYAKDFYGDGDLDCQYGSDNEHCK